MKLHRLITEVRYYDAIKLGYKTFEACLDDTEFEVGDLVMFHKADGVVMRPEAVGPFKITFIQTKFSSGLEKEWCVLGFKPL